MGAFATPEEIQSGLSWWNTNPLDVKDPAAYPGFLDGAWTGLVAGAKSAYWRDVYQAGSPEEKKAAVDQLDQLQNQPTVGFVGRTLQGFSDQMGSVLMSVLGGNVTPQLAAMDAGTKYAQSQTQLNIRQGMDPNTARQIAENEGAALGLGTMLPGSWGFKTLMPDILTSAGVNVAFGGAARFANSEVLERNGYPDMARQYRVFDAESMAVDAILGAFFTGVHRHQEILGIRPTPEHVDDALAVNAGRHADTQTAPGIPADPGAMQAHLNALGEIERAVSEGRLPVFDDSIHDATFVRSPEREAAEAEIMGAMREVVPEVAVREAPVERVDTQSELAVMERAAEVLKAADEGRIPLSMTKDLREIAKENGVAVANDTAPTDVIAELRAKMDEIQSAEGRSVAEEPQPIEVQSAEQALRDRPNLAVGDGSEEPVKAADLFAQHDADIASANELSKLIQVAASCALRA